MFILGIDDLEYMMFDIKLRLVLYVWPFSEIIFYWVTCMVSFCSNNKTFIS